MSNHKRSRIIIRASACLGLLTCLPVFSQVAPSPPEFQTADIHPSAPNMIHAMRIGFSGGRYELRNATVADLIHTAWNVGEENDDENVIGGPEWLYKDRFDVIATAS